MNRFIYFLPGMAGGNAQVLGGLGLLGRFSGCGGALLEHGWTEWREGPAGSGVAVALGMAPAAYDAERQVWIECGGFWVGMDKELRPGPGDLEREVGLDGHAIVLGDGNEWRVPLLRRCDLERGLFAIALPSSLRPVRSGGRVTIQEVVTPRFAPLDKLAEEILTALMEATAWPIEKLFTAAATLLGENYRIGGEEAGLLGLLDASTALSVMQLAVDTPGIRAVAEQLAGQGIVVKEEE